MVSISVPGIYWGLLCDLICYETVQVLLVFEKTLPCVFSFCSEHGLRCACVRPALLILHLFPAFASVLIGTQRRSWGLTVTVLLPVPQVTSDVFTPYVISHHDAVALVCDFPSSHRGHVPLRLIRHPSLASFSLTITCPSCPSLYVSFTYNFACHFTCGFAKSRKCIWSHKLLRLSESIFDVFLILAVFFCLYLLPCWLFSPLNLEDIETVWVRVFTVQHYFQ